MIGPSSIELFHGHPEGGAAMAITARSLRTAAGWTILGILFLAGPLAAGTILKASCPCGYHLDNILAGGGKSNFKIVCSAPAYCAASKTLEILNWLDDAPKCAAAQAKPVFYNDFSLQEKIPAGANPPVVFSWNTDKKGTFLLPDINYLCPLCGKMTLRFAQTGFWD
jgi:hypothetical protein